ncbi:MAG: hypothetical protein ACOC6B_03265 [Thermodesulfobacteriota bacterium]
MIIEPDTREQTAGFITPSWYRGKGIFFIWLGLIAGWGREHFVCLVIRDTHSQTLVIDPPRPLKSFLSTLWGRSNPGQFNSLILISLHPVRGRGEGPDQAIDGIALRMTLLYLLLEGDKDDYLD